MDIKKILLLLCFGYTFLKINAGTHCDALKGEEKEDSKYLTRVFYYGRENNIKILYANNSATARAAASVLYVVARYGHYLRYINVTLEAGPNDVCEYSKRYVKNLRLDETEMVVDLSAVWHTEEDCQANDVRCANSVDPLLCGVAGRLKALPRVGVASPHLLPLVRLAPSVKNHSICQHANSWDSYRGRDLSKMLDHCSFIKHTDDFDYDRNAAQEGNWPRCNNESCLDGQCVVIFTPSDHSSLAQHWAALLANANMSACVLPLEPAGVPRRRLLQSLNPTYERSFIFIDHDVWKTGSVRPMTGTLCGESDCALNRSVDSVISLRVVDASRMSLSAPPLYKTLKKFKMNSYEILQVLKMEAGLNDSRLPAEAACAWAADNKRRLKEWSPVDAKDTVYIIYIFLCKDDQDWQFYKRTIDFAKRLIEDRLNKSRSYTYELRARYLACNDTNEILREIKEPLGTYLRARVAGLVLAGVGALAASGQAKVNQGALALAYDAPAHRDDGGALLPSVVGDVTHLVCALRRFLTDHNWQRVGILSEQSALAGQFINALTSDRALVTWQESIEHKHEVETAVARLRERDTRVWLVVANGTRTAQALCTARRAGVAGAEHAWVLPALTGWRTPSCAWDTLPLNLYSVSFWWRGEELAEADTESAMRQQREKLRKALDGTVPPLAASLVDAVLAIASGYDGLLYKYPDRWYDLPFSEIKQRVWAGLFENATDKNDLENEGIIRREGIIQKITSTKSVESFVREKPLVFVHQWTLDGGGKMSALAVWRVQDIAAKCRVQNIDIVNAVADTLTLDDGTAYCRTTYKGDHFTRHCHDSAWAGTITTLFVLVVGVAALCVVRQRHERRRRAADKKRRIRLLEDVHVRLVRRSRLTLCDEQLGKGYFGRVVRGVLRETGSTLDVAVKELTEDAPPGAERALLREAALLGALPHRHVVRLEGVCAEGEVLLLVMRRAFFGDLSSYLRARRLLEDEAGEARHVSAAALTRLLREAAAALAYVHAVHVVHRDVRAANCLVDEWRALLLADFGMARHVNDDEEYVCRQRAMFPVRWMAPESVRHGVFSAASDVWALGALALELVTLGERPFSEWPMGDILVHLRAGGKPPLPPDVTPDMRELVSMCWSQRAETRSEAARVGAWLAEHPLALAPLRRAPAPPQSVETTTPPQDSGFSDASGEHVHNV